MAAPSEPLLQHMCTSCEHNVLPKTLNPNPKKPPALSATAAGTWAISGLVPGLICLVLTPALLYILYPPEVKDTPDAPAKVRRQCPDNLV